VAWEDTFPLRSRDGEFRWFLSRAVPIRDERGAVVRWFGTNTDVTEQRATAEALREADRRKDEFLAMLSHELRNPLAPIVNAIHLLRRGGLDGERAARAHAMIERQANHLARLVDDLLDVTRIARGKIRIRRERVDLRELVLRAAEDFRAAIEERGVSFRVEVPPAAVAAEADPTRVTQVIGNLLSNAVKVTEAGEEITVRLAVTAGAAAISVRDTGSGIDPALLPRVFDPFVQGETSLARTEGGLGLGLALVKAIVELHGGTVRVESAGAGRGAEFEVAFPVTADPALRPAPEAGARGRRARKVLVVDDNVDAAESLADLVRLLGHEVEVAFDGPSAIRSAAASRPDVVLCDIGLPGMDGYAVAQAIRAGGCDGRLVAVTGYAQPEDVQRAAAAGFDGHVPKPPDAAVLERLLA
jgi:signal transduction histidine kinase/CheY-like chemotaxis protein